MEYIVLILVVAFFMILISLQLAVNKILVELKELNRNLYTFIYYSERTKDKINDEGKY